MARHGADLCPADQLSESDADSRLLGFEQVAKAKADLREGRATTTPRRAAHTMLLTHWWATRSNVCSSFTSKSGSAASTGSA
ncbi:MAG TPA: hypothetical protein VHM25_18035, partial [Polyangiaceae bacterium]|nr:hypothetical protein [Polyangiaceae bacterium]